MFHIYITHHSSHQNDIGNMYLDIVCCGFCFVLVVNRDVLMTKVVLKQVTIANELDNAHFQALCGHLSIVTTDLNMSLLLLCGDFSPSVHC